MNHLDVTRPIFKAAFFLLALSRIPALSQTAVSTYWVKLGARSAENFSIYNPFSITTPIPLGAALEADAFIYSTPDANGNRFVSRFDQKSDFTKMSSIGLQRYFGRGGVVDIRSSSGNARVVLTGPPTGNNGQGSPTSHFFQGYHKTWSGNRGWLRLEYRGSPVSSPVPYAVKSKYMPIGVWNMTEANPSYSYRYFKDFAFSPSGIHIGRVMGFDATVQSDPGQRNGWLNAATKLHSYPPEQGFGGAKLGSGGGGGAILDGISDRVVLWNAKSWKDNFGDAYSNPTVNRGYFRVDYLAGSCEQGAAGFLLKAVPSSKTNNCIAGSGGNMIVEGAGSDILNRADEFTYLYKPYTNPNTDGNKTFIARIASQAVSPTTTGATLDGYAKTGLMVRFGTGAGSAHMTMALTPNGTMYMLFRPSEGELTASAWAPVRVAAPVWVRIVKSGGTLTGSYSTNGTTWNQVGAQKSTANSYPYYAGIAASSRNSAMTTSSVSNLNF